MTTSEQTSQITHNASEVLTETVNNAERITTQVQSASEIGSRLHEHAKNISAMIGTIDAIASQTNILALNAAIEAARAGESGRGFSVVAEEVRKLALSTSAATQKITHMVEDNSRLIEQMYQQLDQINQFLGDEREKIHDLSRGFSEINSGVSAFVDVIHRLNV
ncbi:methyl-accepting chemotaxis protein [Dickeya dadantii]|uniref:methyl-accepting chemotaxis protein n=1 Tax=Dickeya dadantii TaxID=204038 RepID=UPI0039BF3708